MLKANLRRVAAHAVRTLPGPLAYHARMLAEKLVYRLTPAVHDLPPIFHYWSNAWLRPRFEALGFASPEDFFCRRVLAAAHACAPQRLRVLSVGCGHGGLEHLLAAALRGDALADPELVLVDVNRHVLQRAVDRLARDGFQRVLGVPADLNAWVPSQRFDIVIANQCLHHVVALESLLDGLQACIEPHGRLLVSDVIGRNGHRLWPEARAVLEPLWRGLPPSKQHDRTLGRRTTALVDHDHSLVAFEGIRSQDILSLLLERFDAGLFAPHTCLVIPIVERRFGWNFEVDDPADRAFVDALDATDQDLLSRGTLKPTQLVAEFGAPGKLATTAIAPWAHPQHCVRDPAA